jgi:hypothetical protein
MVVVGASLAVHANNVFGSLRPINGLFRAKQRDLLKCLLTLAPRLSRLTLVL